MSLNRRATSVFATFDKFATCNIAFRLPYPTGGALHMRNEMNAIRLTSGKIPIFRFLLLYTLSFDHRSAQVGQKKGFRAIKIAKKSHRN